MPADENQQRIPKVRISKAGVHYRTTSDILQSPAGREAIQKVNNLFKASNPQVNGDPPSTNQE